ncbi:hypothetical protein ARMGADRAFT_1029334 [Armillaria gallica]|uniref:Uncharacterized protein n=1 Tax=Armillaria gallica TaxID=47427 RepID=A0A2H3E5R9_ARMGA|nr:hypothetical protein ARMGADRAFT_1029334 [Armillaria gallica]
MPHDDGAWSTEGSGNTIRGGISRQASTLDELHQYTQRRPMHGAPETAPVAEHGGDILVSSEDVHVATNGLAKYRDPRCNTQLYYEVELGIIGVVKAEGLPNTGQDVFKHFLETGTVNDGIEVEERHGVVCSAIKTISQLMNASKDLRLHKAGSDDD